MPILGALFVSLFGSLAAFLTQFVARKVAVIGTALAAFSAITVALMATFNGIVSPLVAQMFATSYGQALGLAFPPVAGTCLASIGLAWTACALYSWQRQAINITTSA